MCYVNTFDPLGRVRVTTCFVMLIFIVALLGCAGQQTKFTKPVDIAAESGKQISKAYLVAYSMAKAWTEKGTPMQREYAVSTLNPRLNKLKPVIVDFDRAVAHWQRTGQAGDDVVAKQKEMEQMYDEIQNLITDALTDKLKE